MILVMGIVWASISFQMADTAAHAELGDGVVSMLTDRIVQGCYDISYQLSPGGDGSTEPADLFAPRLAQRREELTDKLKKSQDVSQAESSDDPYMDDALHQEMNAINDSVRWLNDMLLHQELPLENLFYYAVDTESGAVLTNAPSTSMVGYALQQIAEGHMDDSTSYAFPFAAGLSFDRHGKASVLDLSHAVQNSRAAAASASLCSALTQRSIDIRQQLQGILEGFAGYEGMTIAPRSMKIMFVMPDTETLTARDDLSLEILFSRANALGDMGYTAVFFLALGLALLAGFAMGLVKEWALADALLIRRIPLEAVALAVLLLPGVEERIRCWTADPVAPFSFAVDLLLLLLLLSAAYTAGLCFSPLASTAPRAYLQERSLCVRYWPQLKKGGMKLWRACTELDLSLPHRRAVLKLTVLNCVILIAAWFLSPLGMVLYSVLLFFFLDRRYRRVQAQYRAVLDAARCMADGRLDTDIQEDAGPFTELRDELIEIRQGFQKAVDAEVKSQSMKTELITNVSHDLKTPLTAIITYVDLLKREDITEEERRDYIDTLDRKSQRLKQLITDLFDVSKAVSRDMTPELLPLDLGALLKQVRSELGDKLDASGLDFRWSIPVEKVPVLLDGQRTYRVFENLLINIIKYAMPGTRAYIDLVPGDDSVSVTFRNISDAELRLNGMDLTERFVRGDPSRSTEGSGLGLAIVKSFVELQGGSFHIEVDGDLFKAQILWPLRQEEPMDIPFEQ